MRPIRLSAHDSDCTIRRAVVFAYTSTETKVNRSTILQKKNHIYLFFFNFILSKRYLMMSNDEKPKIAFDLSAAPKLKKVERIAVKDSKGK